MRKKSIRLQFLVRFKCLSTMAEKKGESYPQLPNAPNAGQHFSQDTNLYHQRPPPPSYEESQRWNPQPMYAPPQVGNMYPASIGNPPPYAGVHQAMPYSQHGLTGYASSHSQYVFNYNAQQQMIPAMVLSSQQNASAVNAVTVNFDAGSRFKGKGAGSITIPPPPPGCAPTPEQMAALQGQPVILKKKKNSFF